MKIDKTPFFAALIATGCFAYLAGALRDVPFTTQSIEEKVEEDHKHCFESLEAAYASAQESHHDFLRIREYLEHSMGQNQKLIEFNEQLLDENQELIDLLDENGLLPDHMKHRSSFD